MESAQCEAGDTCVVVNTFCCPRPINEENLEEVTSALEGTEDLADECLADCLPADVPAACDVNLGQCRFITPEQ